MLLLTHPSLWRYAIVPVLLNTLITVFVLLLLVVAGATFAVTLHPRFPQAWWGLVLEVLTGAVLLLVAGVLAVGVGMVLNSVLCGHFRSRLAREVDLLLGMTPDQMHETPFRHQVADSLHDFGQLVVVNLGLLALNIVPVAGTIAAVLLGCYLNGKAMGMDYLAMPMSARALSRAEQQAFVGRHRWHTIGLGTAVFVLNLIPVIGSVLLTTASAGAVLLYRRLEPAARGTAPHPEASDALAGAHSLS